MTVLTTDAADCRLVADVVAWFFGEVLLDVGSNLADQRSSSYRPVIWQSVVELMIGMIWLMECDGELLGNYLVMLANWHFPSLLIQFDDICHFTSASVNS